MNRRGLQAAPLLGIGLCLLMISCASPGPRLDPEGARMERLRREGDLEFAKMHWRGWKNAAGLFEEALAERDDPALRQRLFTAYVLLSLRESELSFRNESWLQKAGSLLPGLPASPCSGYLALAREKLRVLSSHWSGSPGHVIEEGRTPAPREAGSALPHYMHLLSLSLSLDPQTVDSFRAEGSEFLRLHGGSNLAVFLRTFTPPEMDDKLAAFPDFAEMYLLRGNGFNSGRKYQAAMADYQRAAEIMPVLFKACNAMATLCYSLEEYELALVHYGRTLEIFPLEPTALFGRAISLSELRRYEESDRALQKMIAEQTFFHGEANYYLAKNGYYRQRWDDARTYLDRAAAYIPDSPEMNMLSGLLYLDRGAPGRAARDFRRVLEQEPQHAEAWYFLGQAALQEKSVQEARRHFAAAVANFRRELEGFDAKLALLRSEAEADPYQGNYYAKRLRQRRAYVRQARERLAALQELFPRPPLPGLRELLAALSAPYPGQ